MGSSESRARLEPGALARDFTLAAANRAGTVSLADYRGRSPLLLGLFRGLYCAFCRRAIAQLGVTGEKLRALGVETLGVVATKPENARLYFRFHPTPLLVAADPELVTHRAYGLPRLELPWQAVESTRINPTGELGEPLPIWEATKALGRLDGFRPTDTDREDMPRTWNQAAGQFLIDRDGVVRWVYVEAATGDLAGIGKFAAEGEILALARTLAS